MSVCSIKRGRNDTYEEGIDQRISNHSKLIPIKSGERVKSQAGHTTSNRSEFGVLRGNPSYPVKVRHRLEDVVGEQEVDEHGDETVHEPPHPGDCPTVYCIVGFGMKGAAESNDRQVGGPDSMGRVDEKSTGEAGETVTYEVDGEGQSN